MKATDFASFFGYTIIRHYGCDEKNGLYRFEVIDDSGRLNPVYIIGVEDLTYKIHLNTREYVFETLAYHGFDYEKRGNDFGAALKFIKTKEALKDSVIKEVVECILDPHLITDDISDYESIRHSARALLVDFFSELWLWHAYEVIFDLQHDHGMTLDRIIDSIVKECEAEGEYSENDAELSIGAMDTICRLEATLAQQTQHKEQIMEVFAHMLGEAKKYEEVAA